MNEGDTPRYTDTAQSRNGSAALRYTGHNGRLFGGSKDGH